MDSNDKLPENAAAVVIEDDIWTGAPYSNIGGVSAKVLKMRFTPVEIVEHEKLLRYIKISIIFD